MVLLALSRAIWSTRCDKNGSPSVESLDTVAHRIAAIFRSLHRLPTDKSASKKVRDKTKQRREFLAMRTSLPPDALHSFTDGSSYASERAGSGYVICTPSNLALHYHSEFLGPTSNNVAELDAMTRSLHHFIAIIRQSSRQTPRPITIFSDSRYALNIANGIWKAKAHLPLVRDLQSVLARLRSLTTVSLFWVPAHAGIFFNDVADLLAKRGADGISSSAQPDAASLLRLRQGGYDAQPDEPPSKRSCNS